MTDPALRPTRLHSSPSASVASIAAPARDDSPSLSNTRGLVERFVELYGHSRATGHGRATDHGRAADHVRTITGRTARTLRALLGEHPRPAYRAHPAWLRDFGT